MYIDFDSETPIYLQVAEEIENAILSDIYADESQVPSTTEISVTYRINPATALKGISKLVDEGILYKKRGVGMFVEKGAKEKIQHTRKQIFEKTFITPLIKEARKLSVSKKEIAAMIEKGYEQ